MFMRCAVEDMVGSCACEANRAAPVLALEETWDGDDSVAAKWLVQGLRCWQTLPLLSNWPNAPGMRCVLCLWDGFPWGQVSQNIHYFPLSTPPTALETRQNLVSYVALNDKTWGK